MNVHFLRAKLSNKMFQERFMGMISSLVEHLVNII